MFKIGDFSRLANISVRMLRHYDKLNLLKPQLVDSFSGYRYYTAQQLNTANKIQKLKEMGFSLAIVKTLLDTEADVATLKGYFSVREAELKQQQEKLARQNAMLDSAVKIIKEDMTKMNYHVLQKEIPERYVASVRQHIDSYDQEGKLWHILFAEIERQRVKLAAEPLSSALFHDAEYKESNVDVEIQIAVDGKYQDNNQVIFKQMEKSTVASAIVNGSYQQMGKVMETIAQWIEDNNYQLDGPMFNIYHVSPGQDPNPDNWVTEVCLPICRQKTE
jgi:DNA-binding transcriptional MerR regulator